MHPAFRFTALPCLQPRQTRQAGCEIRRLAGLAGEVDTFGVSRSRVAAKDRPATCSTGRAVHNTDVHVGCEHFFRTMYNGHLIAEWLPVLDGVVDKLTAGAFVADVGAVTEPRRS
jgi:hypothetical protein